MRTQNRNLTAAESAAESSGLETPWPPSAVIDWPRRSFSLVRTGLDSSPLVRRAAAVLVLFFISSSLILPNLGYPQKIIFDETYFIPAAQKYLNGVFFLEAHPPLGKLLIALGQYWVHPEAVSNQFIGVEKIDADWPSGVDMTGYRLVPALFGILNPLLVFAIIAIVLQSDLFALLLSSFIALDNALVVQSRAALLDSILLFFCLGTILLFVRLLSVEDERTRQLVPLFVLAGAFSGAAANVKLSGLFVAVLAAVYAVLLVRARAWPRLAAFGTSFAAGFAVVFLGLWAVHFALATRLQPGNDYGISDAHRAILEGTYNPDALTRFAIQIKDGLEYEVRYEAGVPKLDLSKPDEIGSAWYQWLVGGRAINYRWETPDGQTIRYIYLVENPVTTLIALLGAVCGTALVVADVLFRFLAAERRKWVYALVVLYWAYIIPMMLITRVMYLYHYFPALVVGVLLFAVVLAEARAFSAHTKRDIVVVAVIFSIFSFWMLKPLTFYEPLTTHQFEQRNIWPAWDLQCVDCSGARGP